MSDQRQVPTANAEALNIQVNEAYTNSPLDGGKVALYISNALLLISGPCQIGLGIALYNKSGSSLFGLWYIAVFTGILAILNTYYIRKINTAVGIRHLCFAAATTFIMSLVSSFSFASKYNLLYSIQACAAATSSSAGPSSTSCYPILSNNEYYCTGNKQYNTPAAGCQATQNTYGSGKSLQCACVNIDFQNTGLCYFFNDTPSCQNLTDIVPQLLRAEYAFAVLACMLSFFITTVCCCISYRRDRGTDTLAQAHMPDNTTALGSIYVQRDNYTSLRPADAVIVRDTGKGYGHTDTPVMVPVHIQQPGQTFHIAQQGPVPDGNTKGVEIPINVTATPVQTNYHSYDPFRNGGSSSSNTSSGGIGNGNSSNFGSNSGVTQESNPILRNV